VALQQQLEQSQKLALTQAMQQSLRFLQMPALELDEYLQELALSNPILSVETPAIESSYAAPAPAEGDDPSPEFLESSFRSGGGGSESGDPMEFAAARPMSLARHLGDQLGQMKALDQQTLARCLYLVGCLNSLGYLDCPLPELAEELRQTLFDMEQALFVVQSLDPPGVGARSLSECLLLQLAQSSRFTELNIHLIQSGLPLLAKGDIPGLARLLGASQSAVREAAEVVRSLNPIPSRGFYTGESSAYIQPEAVIRREHGQLSVEMNDLILPRLSLDPEYCAMLKQNEYQDAHPYLREKLTEARAVLSGVQERYGTISRVLEAVVRLQREYFLSGAPLQPMAMNQLAEQLEVHPSTVSRAVKGKYIQFEGRVFPLRSLFTAPLQTSGGSAVSAQAVKQQLQRFIGAEDPAAPLSDDTLAQALAGVGIVISRRTVAKYRAELNIPGASGRKRAKGGPRS